MLPVALSIPLIDIAVTVGQDVVLTPGGLDPGLGRFGLGPGLGLAGSRFNLARPGLGDLAGALRATAGFPRLPGPLGYVVGVARPVIEVRAVPRLGYRMHYGSAVPTMVGTAVGVIINHIIVDVVDIDIIIAAVAPPAAAAIVPVAPPGAGEGPHRRARGKAHEPGTSQLAGL